MKRNAVSLTMAAAMLTGMLGSAPAFAADLSNLPDKVEKALSQQHQRCTQIPT